MLALPYGAADTGPMASLLAVEHAVARQESCQMRADRDRPHPGTTAPVRNAERLVQIEMRYVGAELAGRGESHQGIEVRAIHIDLPAMRVHDLANFADAGLEDAVRRRIRNHDRGQIVAMRLGLGAKIGEIHIALGVARDDDHAHARHLRRGRVGAVSRRRNEADVAMRFAATGVIGADDQQAGVLTLRARIRLQRNRGVAGHRAQHLLELGDHRRGSLRSGRQARTDACARTRAR